MKMPLFTRSSVGVTGGESANLVLTPSFASILLGLYGKKVKVFFFFLFYERVAVLG